MDGGCRVHVNALHKCLANGFVPQTRGGALHPASIRLSTLMTVQSFLRFSRDSGLAPL